MNKTFLSDGIDESFAFPDGQPHISVSSDAVFDQQIFVRIARSEDVIKLALLAEIAKSKLKRLRVSIAYLLGGRMDRRLSKNEPHTLKAMCRIINSLDFESVFVFCPHSQSTIDLLDNVVEDTLIEKSFYDLSIQRLLGTQNDPKEIRRDAEFSLVFPDAGAKKRSLKIGLIGLYPNAEIVILEKDRNERTGTINGTKIISGKALDHCIIIDDLCDGGATFSSAAQTLRVNGATRVDLAVCHGIFSKGLPLPGIDFVCSTNSFAERESNENLWIWSLG